MKAYQALYELLAARLKNFCFSFVKSNEVADEIVSDVFIKLWQIKNKLPENSQPQSISLHGGKKTLLNYITSIQKPGRFGSMKSILSR